MFASFKKLNQKVIEGVFGCHALVTRAWLRNYFDCEAFPCNVDTLFVPWVEEIRDLSNLI